MIGLSLSNFFSWFNKQNTVAIIFIVSLASFMEFTLSGGEEQYFAFAKQYMNPQWMPNSFSLNHPAGGNWAFQVIFGYLLRYLSFEQLAIWSKLINYFLYAIPLALIFRKLKLSNIEIVFILQLLFFPHQSIWAGEWIYKNIEEKTLAYIFVFWSIYYLLNDKPIHSSIHAAIATYFHFLVGGWMFLFVILYFLVHNRSWRSFQLNGTIYTLLVLPLIIYLAKTYFVDNPAIINGVNTNSIYVFFRLKHHIGMFGDIHYFIGHFLPSVLFCLLLFILCIFYSRKIKQPAIQQLNLLNIIIFSQQFVFIGIGFLDKNGIFMKTYPFRTSTLSAFFIILEVALISKYYLAGNLYPKLVSSSVGFSQKSYQQRKMLFKNGMNSILFLLFLIAFIPKTNDTIKLCNSSNSGLDAPMIELIEYCKTTPKESVFLFVDNDYPISFIRRAEREKFVVEKFTPTKSTTIYEWYNRLICQEKLKKDIRIIDSIKTIYRIDYLVSDSSYTYPSLKLEKQVGSHNLYRVTTCLHTD